jgi:hypothetical protein
MNAAARACMLQFTDIVLAYGESDEYRQVPEYKSQQETYKSSNIYWSILYSMLRIALIIIKVTFRFYNTSYVCIYFNTNIILFVFFGEYIHVFRATLSDAWMFV